MDNNKIKSIYFEYFKFILDIGYNKIDIYENEYDATLAIVQYNLEIKQKISFCFYKKGNIRPGILKDDAIYISIFNKNNEHIDLSRLFHKDKLINNRCVYQYIELSDENSLTETLTEISKILQFKYLPILKGLDWIDISYNLKDDY